MIQIEIVDEQQGVAVSLPELRAAAAEVLRAEGHRSAEVSIAVVDNAAMQALNRRYLDHDWPTDVLSFAFDEAGSLSGEVILNAELAAEVAEKYGWTESDELLLYLVHGLLHLCGYDDGDAASQGRMRRREQELLAEYGLHPVYDARESEAASAQSAAPSGEE